MHTAQAQGLLRNGRPGHQCTGDSNVMDITNFVFYTGVMDITNFVLYTGVTSFIGVTKFVHTGDGIFSFTGEQ